VRELAPAKINLCLYVGPLRTDGRHELVSVMQSIDLADELELRDHDGPADEVRCPGVQGPNLAERAIGAFRESTGWSGPPQLLDIDKRIPVAAGLGGGSADAAATLRLLARRSGLGGHDQLLDLARELGADVPSQLQPGRWLAQGIGERLTALPQAPPLGFLVLPSHAALSTAAVYDEADRLGLTRTKAELEGILATLEPSSPEPINDLQPAARSLEPTIDAAIERVSDEGAASAFVTGSGPTVVGLFPTLQRAEAAARRLRESGVDAWACSALHNPSSA
jgi:4-diphosphocytidyl-2-C-methyl-D-erythritol kinase